MLVFPLEMSLAFMIIIARLEAENSHPKPIKPANSKVINATIRVFMSVYSLSESVLSPLVRLIPTYLKRMAMSCLRKAMVASWRALSFPQKPDPELAV